MFTPHLKNGTFHIIAALVIMTSGIFQVSRAEWSRDPYAPMIVVDAGYTLHYPHVIPSTNNGSDDGFIVAWHDFRRSQIRMQKIDQEGELVWDEDGVTVRFNVGHNFVGGDGMPFEIADMTSDGTGGAIIGWMDWTFSDCVLEHGAENNEIYAKHITAEGEVEWGDENGLLICSFVPEVGNTRRLDNLESDGEGGCLLVWHDPLYPNDRQRNGLYGQRISNEGELIWGEDGVRIGRAFNSTNSYVIVDSLGGFFISLHDGDIQHLTSEGELWEEPISNEIDEWQMSPRCPAQTGSVILKMSFNRDGFNDFATNLLSDDGQLLWELPGVQYTPIGGLDHHYYTRISTDFRSGCYMLVNYPSRMSRRPIEIQKIFHVDCNGNMVVGLEGVDIPYNLDEGGVVLAGSDKHGVYISYSVFADSAKISYLQKIGYHGDFLWGDEPLIAWADTSEDLRRYGSASDVDVYGNFMGVKSYFHSGHNSRIYAWVVSPEGILGEYTDHIIAPPSAFNLLEPTQLDTINPGDTIIFSWEEPVDPNPEDEISYMLWFKSGEDSMHFDLDQTSFAIQPDSLFENVEPNSIITWWVYAISNGDTVECLNRFNFVIQLNRIDNSETDLPLEFAIKSIYPNPFNSYTTISYSLPVQSHISLQVFNTRGQLLDILVDGNASAGIHSIVWDGSELVSGVYLLRMIDNSGIRRVIKKVTLIK